MGEPAPDVTWAGSERAAESAETSNAGAAPLATAPTTEHDAPEAVAALLARAGQLPAANAALPSKPEQPSAAQLCPQPISSSAPGSMPPPPQLNPSALAHMTMLGGLGGMGGGALHMLPTNPMLFQPLHMMHPTQLSMLAAAQASNLGLPVAAGGGHNPGCSCALGGLGMGGMDASGAAASAAAAAAAGVPTVGSDGASSGDEQPGMLAQGEQSFVCNICRKSFKREMNLIFHMTTHRQRQTVEGVGEPQNSNAPVKCSDCTKVFATKYQAKKHFLRRHFKGDRPYKCRKCNKKAFTVKEDLTMHLKACGQVFTCSCGIRLCSLGALKRHAKYFKHEPANWEGTPVHGGAGEDGAGGGQDGGKSGPDDMEDESEDEGVILPLGPPAPGATTNGLGGALGGAEAAAAAAAAAAAGVGGDACGSGSAEHGSGGAGSGKPRGGRAGAAAGAAGAAAGAPALRQGLIGAAAGGGDLSAEGQAAHTLLLQSAQHHYAQSQLQPEQQQAQQRAVSGAMGAAGLEQLWRSSQQVNSWTQPALVAAGLLSGVGVPGTAGAGSAADASAMLQQQMRQQMHAQQHMTTQQMHAQLVQQQLSALMSGQAHRGMQLNAAALQQVMQNPALFAQPGLALSMAASQQQHAALAPPLASSHAPGAPSSAAANGVHTAAIDVVVSAPSMSAPLPPSVLPDPHKPQVSLPPLFAPSAGAELRGAEASALSVALGAGSRQE